MKIAARELSKSVCLKAARSLKPRKTSADTKGSASLCATLIGKQVNKLENARRSDRPEMGCLDGFERRIEQVEQAVHVLDRLAAIVGQLTAVGLGDKRCANVVLLGRLSTHLPLPEESWRRAFEQRFPKKFLELNLGAFDKGRETA